MMNPTRAFLWYGLYTKIGALHLFNQKVTIRYAASKNGRAGARSHQLFVMLGAEDLKKF
jgi:hypothetical protein